MKNEKDFPSLLLSKGVFHERYINSTSTVISQNPVRNADKTCKKVKRIVKCDSSIDKIRHSAEEQTTASPPNAVGKGRFYIEI
jgi:hypothetical protein